ncbi:MAG: hypothetical protein ACRD82_22160, partial [Blastocatellia bacterium]
NIPKGNWQVFGDNKEVSTMPLRLNAPLIAGVHATVAPRSALILGEARGDSVLPGLPFTNDKLST